MDASFAFGGLEDAGADLEERAFAAAVFADDAEGFATGDFEGDVAEGPVVGVEAAGV